MVVKVRDKVTAGGFAFDQDCFQTTQPLLIDQPGAIVIHQVEIIVGKFVLAVHVRPPCANRRSTHSKRARLIRRSEL